MEKKRSIGVIIFGVMAIIISLVQLCAYFSMLLLPSINFQELLIPIIISVSFLISGIFILKLKNWARVIFIFQMIYWIIAGLIGVNAFAFLDWIGIGKNDNYPVAWIGWVIFFLLPSIFALFFFTRPNVKAQFK